MLSGYQTRCNIPSDINEHLPVLYEYAKECSSVIECGVRSIVSSYAFGLGIKAQSDNSLIMVDPYGSNNMPEFLKLCKEEGVNAEFLNISDLECPIIKTDLLFIDTWHVYGQLKRELSYWHSSVDKYIIMHDTTVDAWYGESVRLGLNAEEQSKKSGIPVDEINKGLWPAIREFLEDHSEWKLEKRLTNNNGLTILKRMERIDFPTLVTYSNYGYIDFAKNLIMNLARVLKNHKLHFYCLDKQTYDELSTYTHVFLTVELFEQDVTSDFQPFNTSLYKKLTHTKVSVLRAAFAQYSFIHFIDCDIVCLKEPSAEHYVRYDQFDIVFQPDIAYKGPDFKHNFFSPAQCTGNMTMRRSKGTMELLTLLERKQVMLSNSNDQECLQKIFDQHRAFDVRTFRYCKLYVYPIEEYTNGSWVDFTDKTYFFHANHVSGKERKIALLKKVKHWFL
jgi:hypothetical protein